MSGFTDHIDDVRLAFDRGGWAKCHKSLDLIFALVSKLDSSNTLWSVLAKLFQ